MHGGGATVRGKVVVSKAKALENALRGAGQVVWRREEAFHGIDDGLYYILHLMCYCTSECAPPLVVVNRDCVLVPGQKEGQE